MNKNLAKNLKRPALEFDFRDRIFFRGLERYTDPDHLTNDSHRSPREALPNAQNRQTVINKLSVGSALGCRLMPRKAFVFVHSDRPLSLTSRHSIILSNTPTAENPLNSPEKADLLSEPRILSALLEELTQNHPKQRAPHE